MNNMKSTSVKTGGAVNMKFTTAKIAMIAMAICINYIGGQLALALHLPIYLDSIGTILIGAMFGPAFGVLPPMISGILMAFTGDIYSLYFAPVGMILGLTAGFVLKRIHSVGFMLLLSAFLITLPGTIVCAMSPAQASGAVSPRSRSRRRPARRTGPRRRRFGAAQVVASGQCRCHAARWTQWATLGATMWRTGPISRMARCSAAS